MSSPTPKVYLGGNLVLASGTVCVPPGHSVEVVPLPFGEGPLHFIFEFRAEEGEPSQVEFDGTSAPTVKISLINFKNSLGQATTQPMVIGKFGDRELKLMVSVHSIGTEPDQVRLFSYTMTLEGREDA